MAFFSYIKTKLKDMDIQYRMSEGERKCQNQMATKMPRRPDGDLTCSWEPNGNQNKPFWTPLGHHGHLGRHLVAIRS